MITFGNASGAVPPFAPLVLSSKSLKVCRPNSGVYIQTKEEFDMYATELMELLSSGKLKITISQIYDLKDAAKAHTDLEVYDLEPVLISGEENNWEISLEDILASGLLQRGISTICCKDTDRLVMSIHST